MTVQCAMGPERDIEKIARGWKIAMGYSEGRLRRIHGWDEEEMERAVREGRVVLETVCLFVHACVKRGQYSMPHEFWRILHAEYGIVVYPSAIMDEVDVVGLGSEVTYTEAYYGHVVMYGRCCLGECPRCPMDFLREPPPVYMK